MDRSQRFLARRYAQAFLQVHPELTLTEKAVFKRAIPLFKRYRNLCFLFDLSILSLEEKEKIFIRYQKELQLPESSVSLFKLLITHKRSELLVPIFEQLVDLLQERSKTEFFTVESALPFSEEDKKTVEQFLREQVARPIVCTYVVKESLIAGIRVYNEKYIWEHSARAQLRALNNLEKR